VEAITCSKYNLNIFWQAITIIEMKEIIQRNIQGWKVLSFFIAANLVYAYMMIISIPKVMFFSNGMRILDMMPTGYNFEYVNTLFTTLGEDGRNAYLYGQIPADMIYPFLYGISFCLLLAFFLNKLNKLNGNFFYLVFLPIIGGVFDYLENTGTIIMLNNYPDISDASVNITNTFSIIKSLSTTIYFVVLIITLIALGIKTIKRNKSSITN